jgi:hypothetical protein
VSRSLCCRLLSPAVVQPPFDALFGNSDCLRQSIFSTHQLCSYSSYTCMPTDIKLCSTIQHSLWVCCSWFISRCQDMRNLLTLSSTSLLLFVFFKIKVSGYEPNHHWLRWKTGSWMTIPIFANQYIVPPPWRFWQTSLLISTTLSLVRFSTHRGF